ncbi:hypothetical protein, partial [Nonomuraea deserti]|uniref:hypothetical protein n=1 Tax=Nonomuraea deserti TaxID=1848322 RepID=UPI001C70A665
RALLTGSVTAHQAQTVGIAVDGRLLQVRATDSGIEVSPHEGGDLDAVLRAEASIVLGLAAGALTLDDVRELVEIEGDEAAVRVLFKESGRNAEVRDRGPAL